MAVALEAYVATAHKKRKKRGRAFAKKMADLLVERIGTTAASPLRPNSAQAEMIAAHLDAVTLFRRILPAMLRHTSKGSADT